MIRSFFIRYWVSIRIIHFVAQDTFSFVAQVSCVYFEFTNCASSSRHPLPLLLPFNLDTLVAVKCAKKTTNQRTVRHTFWLAFEPTSTVSWKRYQKSSSENEIAHPIAHWGAWTLSGMHGKTNGDLSRKWWPHRGTVVNQVVWLYRQLLHFLISHVLKPMLFSWSLFLYYCNQDFKAPGWHVFKNEGSFTIFLEDGSYIKQQVCIKYQHGIPLPHLSVFPYSALFTCCKCCDDRLTKCFFFLFSVFVFSIKEAVVSENSLLFPHKLRAMLWKLSELFSRWQSHFLYSIASGDVRHLSSASWLTALFKNAKEDVLPV